MWSNNNKMKKKTKVIVLIVLSFLTALSLWAAANFKKMSDLNIFNIEED
jgi:hypothetical protein